MTTTYMKGSNCTPSTFSNPLPTGLHHFVKKIGRIPHPTEPIPYHPTET
jgi:hypothetical protein